MGLFAVVVLVGVLSNGRGGGDTGELVDRIKSGLEEREIPRPLTDCTVRRLEATLDNGEIEKLYDSPRGQREGTTAVLDNPKVKKAAEKSMLACSLGLMRSGRLSREELLKALRGLGEPS